MNEVINKLVQDVEELKRRTAPVEDGLSLFEARLKYGADNMEVRAVERQIRLHKPLTDHYMVNDFSPFGILKTRFLNRVAAIKARAHAHRTAIEIPVEAPATAQEAEAVPAPA